MELKSLSPGPKKTFASDWPQGAIVESAHGSAYIVSSEGFFVKLTGDSAGRLHGYDFTLICTEINCELVEVEK